jgi:uncharacterized DUF497 family protein
MNLIWDEEKDALLTKTRGISFHDFVEIILDKKYLDIVENKARPDQMMFICLFKNYTYCIPFVIDEEQNLVLKTIYPSRKFHSRYGGAL